MPAPLPERPAEIPPQLELFVSEYLKDFNGARAYRVSHPDCHSPGAAAVGAYHALAKPHIKALVDTARDAHWKATQMAAEEALALISLEARVSIADLCDDEGRALKPSAWPAHVRHAVRSYREKDGEVFITLTDGLQARKLMAQAGGKLQDSVKLTFDHAKFLVSDPQNS